MESVEVQRASGGGGVDNGSSSSSELRSSESTAPSFIASHLR